MPPWGGVVNIQTGAIRWLDIGVDVVSPGAQVQWGWKTSRVAHFEDDAVWRDRVAPGVDTDSAELPPPGVYVSPDMYHEYSAIGIVFDDPAHHPMIDVSVVYPAARNKETPP